LSPADTEEKRNPRGNARDDRGPVIFSITIPIIFRSD
jgi:hypothetical protein